MPSEPMSSAIQLEVCVESVESARAAEEGGAARVELCSSLIEGGITPSAGLIAMVRRNVKIAVHVLIRPRAGDFYYTESEFEVMQRDILLARQLGANSVAVGILDIDGRVDVPRTRALIEAAAPMQVTFHRAFDFARDPIEGLRDVISTGATRILTSGGATTAEQGSSVLRELVSKAGSSIAILACGRIRENNVADLIRATGVREVHANLATPLPSPVGPRNSTPSLGSTQVAVDTRSMVLAEAVRAFLCAASAGV
jgi:copper homeostasis protein